MFVKERAGESVPVVKDLDGQTSMPTNVLDEHEPPPPPAPLLNTLITVLACILHKVLMIDHRPTCYRSRF
jgi:hypothetical protein